MEHAERLARSNRGVSSVCACTGFIGKHSYDGVDMTIDLSNSLEVSIYNLAASYFFCPNVGC
jgi:hypothetical protein